jgi:hypothetical protein
MLLWVIEKNGLLKTPFRDNIDKDLVEHFAYYKTASFYIYMIFGFEMDK